MGILLKSQYTVKYTNGEELIDSKNRTYRGYYIYTVKKEMYKGYSAQSKGERLFPLETKPVQGGGISFEPYDYLKPKIYKSTHLRDPIATKPFPTSKEVEVGMFTRYFFLDMRTRNFSETSKDEFNKRTKIDPNIYKFHKIGWWIDSIYQDRNIKTVKSLEKRGNITLDIYEYANQGDNPSLDEAGF